MIDFDEPSDELQDWEYPDEPDDDEYDDDSSETVPCPTCGSDVYEDADRCPVCGEYITARANPWQGRSLAWILLAALGVGATILALTLAG